MADDVILTKDGNTKQVPAEQVDVYKGRGWAEEGGGPVSQRKPAKSSKKVDAVTRESVDE